MFNHTDIRDIFTYFYVSKSSNIILDYENYVIWTHTYFVNFYEDNFWLQIDMTYRPKNGYWNFLFAKLIYTHSNYEYKADKVNYLQNCCTTFKDLNNKHDKVDWTYICRLKNFIGSGLTKSTLRVIGNVFREYFSFL